MSKAYELDALKRHGINVPELGCVMLDVIMPDLSGVIPPAWAYRSAHPDRWWITGVQTEGHATLLYGLLPRLVDVDAVDEVLAGWKRPEVLVGRELEVFRSPFPSEPYACLVARVDCPELSEAHARLSLLPHINTYPTYKPHITLAYVQAEKEMRAIEAVRHILGVPMRFRPLGLNYGRALGEGAN